MFRAIGWESISSACWNRSSSAALKQGAGLPSTTYTKSVHVKKVSQNRDRQTDSDRYRERDREMHLVKEFSGIIDFVLNDEPWTVSTAVFSNVLQTVHTRHCRATAIS